MSAASADRGVTPEGTPGEGGPGTRLRFLVVDDDAFQRWAVARVLRELSAREVAYASDGAAAIASLRAPGGGADVVVTDLSMPGIDGLAFIRLMGGLEHPPALIVASVQDGAVVSAAAALARAYGVPLLGAVRKPLTAEAVRAALRRLPGAGRLAQASGRPAPISEADILAGIEHGEFEAHYQPQVHVATGALRGAEALARWRHPVHGLLLPERFVPLLESCGRMDELTAVMVVQAASACRRWRSMGANVRVSVNLSRRSLLDVTFAERLTCWVRAEGLDPGHMIVELTETGGGVGLGPILENLVRLRLHGFGLAIDDYGTGYSTLQQLTGAPFTELKMDRVFVHEALARRAGRIVLQSSLEMAGRLGLDLVAEGVERPEHCGLLKSLGCPVAQGFLWGRPMPAVDFEALLSAPARRQRFDLDQECGRIPAQP